MTATSRDWEPFELAPAGAHADAPRSIQSLDGVGDRLRAAAFAEIQARDAFLWAAEHFMDVGQDLKETWRRETKLIFLFPPY